MTRLGRRDCQGRKLKTCVPRSTGSRRMQEAFRRLDAIVRLSRTLPTIALFDVVWRLTFAWLQSISKKAATYWQQTYFQKTQVTALRKQMHVGDPGGSCLLASGLASRVHTQEVAAARSRWRASMPIANRLQDPKPAQPRQKSSTSSRRFTRRTGARSSNGAKSAAS